MAGEPILYMYPAACSRVTMSALEEIGLTYETRLVNLSTNANKAPEYLAQNPKGKVPALRWGARMMTENAAILWFLDGQHPEAKLLPRTGDAIADNAGLADLAWCAGVLHPIVRQIRNPARYTAGDTSGVYADGTGKFVHECEAIEARLADRPWWNGDAWSITDVYLYWAYSTAEKGGFPVADYPALVDHATRVRARPSFQRALVREQAVAEAARASMPAMVL